MIDNAVLQVLKEAPLKRTELRYLIDLANDEKNRRMDMIKPELSRINDEKLNIEADIRSVEELFLKGTVDAGNKDYFNRRLSGLLEKVKKLDERRVELENSLGNQMEEIDYEKVIKGIEKFSDALKRTNRVELIQSFIKSRVERVEVSENGKEFCLKLRMGDNLLPEPRWWSIRELNP